MKKQPPTNIRIAILNQTINISRLIQYSASKIISATCIRGRLKTFYNYAIMLSHQEELVNGGAVNRGVSEGTSTNSWGEWVSLFVSRFFLLACLKFTVWSVGDCVGVGARGLVAAR